MADEIQDKPKVVLLDKAWVSAEVARMNAELGFDPGPRMTVQAIRAAMEAEGIRAEDNEASRGIIAMREEKLCRNDC